MLSTASFLNDTHLLGWRHSWGSFRLDKEVPMQSKVGLRVSCSQGHLYGILCHPLTPDLQVADYRGLNLKEGSWIVLAREVTISLWN